MLSKANQNHSLSIANPHPPFVSSMQKLYAALGGLGLLVFVLALAGVALPNKALFLVISIALLTVGVIGYAHQAYSFLPPGIKNNGVWFSSVSSRGLWGWVIGVVLTAFYIVLYFFPQYLGQGTGPDGTNQGLVSLFDPLSKALSGNPASQWFVYGVLYTVGIIIFGVKFIWKYRHNRYQRIRTLSVMFFQTIFAFLVPEIMARLNGDLPYFDLKNIWPLNYYNFDEYRIQGFLHNGGLGWFLLLFAIASIFIITPFLTYKYGKRWYCSWVCGCGGLAETVGDPFRQLSDKSIRAWKIERWLIYSVLVFSVLMTTAVISTYLGYYDDGQPRYWLSSKAFLLGVGLFLTVVFLIVMRYRAKEMKKDAKMAAISFVVLIVGLILIHMMNGGNLFVLPAGQLRTWYGFYIGSIFSGVIGTGFYPILGSRAWCRFGCPMAAILGLQQKLFSRFRITTNGGQCISCGNCSTYCEMGIDVRHYAQRGQDIVRASCVGCGICSAVCPRGVLKLENGPVKGRASEVRNFMFGDV